MSRSAISVARTAVGTARTGVTARAAVSQFRLPEELAELGFTNGYGFTNGFVGTDGTNIPDIIGSRSLFAKNITEGTFYTTGQYYGTFDGSDDMCIENVDGLTTPASVFSAIIAVYRTASGANAGLFGQWRASANRCWLLRAGSNNPAALQVYLSTNGSANTAILTSTDTMIANNAWVILGVTYDGGAADAKIYYLNSNGFSTTTYSTSGAIPATLFASVAPISIGAYPNASYVRTEPFTGRLGIALLNKQLSLTQAQMQAAMQTVNTLGQYF